MFEPLRMEISGETITIDAKECREEIARTIRERGADYVLALKADHERPFDEVVAFWDGACARGMKRDGVRYHREWFEDHGRTEARGGEPPRTWAGSRAGRSGTAGGAW
jgi:predicted transposase YbfD/YdcC